MPQLVREGITSFKLFMAYPGVFMLDDASIFKAMRTSAKAGAMVCMHAENGGAIDVIVKQALAEGKTGPISRADAPDHGRGRSHRPRHRPGRNGRRAGVHRASELQ